MDKRKAKGFLDALASGGEIDAIEETLGVSFSDICNWFMENPGFRPALHRALELRNARQFVSDMGKTANAVKRTLSLIMGEQSGSDIASINPNDIVQMAEDDGP